MTRAEEWAKDHRETIHKLTMLKSERPKFQLKWRPIANPCALEATHDYPIFELTDRGEIAVFAPAGVTIFTIDPTEALQLADFLRSLYQE